MVEVTTQNHLHRSTIVCSSVQRMADSMRALFGLRPPQPPGFTPMRDSTHVETIIESEDSGIGPIRLSTASARLTAYAVRYENNQLGLMLISGRSIAEAVFRGDIANGLETISRATLFHGPIVAHSLVSLMTPARILNLEHTALEHAERTRLHELIMAQTPLDGSTVPQLMTTRIVFRGWSTAPQAAPTCVFEGQPSRPLWLTVCWGAAADQQYTFKTV